MTHYEERLERDLNNIRRLAEELGDMTGKAVRDARTALLERDHQLASMTVVGDEPINRAAREIDRLCHLFVARHLPSAGNLRFISSMLRLTLGLERIGDYASSIARNALHLKDGLPSRVAADFEMMGTQSSTFLHQAMESFNLRNPEMAKEVQALCGDYKNTYHKVFEDLVKVGDKGSREIRDLLAMMSSFNRMERVIAQAKNICEETIFAATGEVKRQKTFKILFVDEKAADVSLIAASFARKNFADCGSFFSAGTAPAKKVNPELAAFAEAHGLDLSTATPMGLSDLGVELEEIPIVVALAPVMEPSQIPFRSVLLNWEMPEKGGLEAAFKVIAHELPELMETLRGDNIG